MQRDRRSAFSGGRMPLDFRLGIVHSERGKVWRKRTMAWAEVPMYGCFLNWSSGSSQRGYGRAQAGLTVIRSLRASNFSRSKLRISINCSGKEYPPRRSLYWTIDLANQPPIPGRASKAAESARFRSRRGMSI